MFAVDTNTLIYFFKGVGRVAERMLATTPGEVAVPAVVLYEIETGIAKSSHPEKRRAQLEQLIDVVSIVPFDRAAATQAARIRAVLEHAGQPIGPLDTLIAGTTMAVGATLVTHNLREFGRIPDLTVIDWYE